MNSVNMISINDETFLVASIIDRCPHRMLLRELFQNAQESASNSSSRKEIRIGYVQVNSVRKLRIWNTGPGMDPVNLYAMCDLSSSIGKLKGLDGNFGIGAKVACLPSNHLGVRYRSCTRNRAFEIVMGKRNGIYGRLTRAGAVEQSGVKQPMEVRDVSGEVVAEGGSLDFDWTEVVLLGMRPEQDTCADPYDSDPPSNEYWIPEYLFRRYFRSMPGVVTYIDPGLQWFSDVRNFVSMAQNSGKYARSELVESRGGIKIHFIYDPAHPERSWENKSSESAIQSSTTMVGVAWRGELFDVQIGSNWFYNAPRYGITFEARHLNVIVELPDDYEVIPDMYRQFLQYQRDTQGHVRVSDFAPLVAAATPKWVRELTRASYGDPLADRTQQLAEELSGLVEQLKFSPVKTLQGEALDAEGMANDFSRKVTNACGLEPILLFDATDVRDRWLEGRAAAYYPETAQLYINMLYESRRALAGRIAAEFNGGHDNPEVTRHVESLANFFYVRRVLRSLICGLAKANNPQNWQIEHIVRATSPEALSTAASDLEDAVAPAVKALRAFAS